MASTLGDVYEFSPFRLEPAERRLTRDGQAIMLSPKAFDLLVVLVARAGRLVTREDLFKEVWRDTFVEEANLSYTVSLLRKALGDDADPHQYIETVQKRGYRFSAPVRTLLGDDAHAESTALRSLDAPSGRPEASVASGLTPSHEPTRVRRWWYALAASAALLLVAAWLLMLRPQQSDRFLTSQQLERFDVIVPEHITLANVDQPAISPDGRLVAFAGNSAGKRQLWVRSLDSSSPVPLAGTDDARFPVWSPDSRTLAFFTGPKLKKVDARGGPVVTLCDAPSQGGAWGRGVILFSAGHVYRVKESGGVPVRVTSFDSSRNETLHFVVGFLSDGHRFVFSDGAQPPTFYVADAESTADRRMLGTGPLADVVGAISTVRGHLLYVQETRLMAQRFDEQTLQLLGPPVKLADGAWGTPSASRSGSIVFRSGRYLTRQLTWIGRDGARLDTVGTADTYTHVELSPSGARAVVVRSAPSIYELMDLWMVDLANKIVSRLTNHPGLEADPAWSPDERSIAYASTQAGVLSPFRKDLVTGHEEQLVESNEALVIDDWTADGRFLIVRKAVGRGIFALPVVDRKLQLLADIPYADQSQVSPDGRWIAFNSNESNAWEVWVAKFPSFTERRQVSSGGGVQPRWRRDGRELFYVAPDGTMMVIEAVPNGKQPDFRAPRRLFKTTLTPASPFISQYDVTADGKRFLILERTPIPPQVLTFLVNWQGLGK